MASENVRSPRHARRQRHCVELHTVCVAIVKPAIENSEFTATSYGPALLAWSAKSRVRRCVGPRLCRALRAALRGRTVSCGLSGPLPGCECRAARVHCSLTQSRPWSRQRQDAGCESFSSTDVAPTAGCGRDDSAHGATVHAVARWARELRLQTPVRVLGLRRMRVAVE